MTRNSLNRSLRRLIITIQVILVLALLARLYEWWRNDGDDVALMASLYAYLKDMSILFATWMAARLSSLFQRRSGFLASLEKEWRGIVATKNVLCRYCELDEPTTDEFLAAYYQLSESIDNMRIVYRNVGEDADRIGLYPYEPLHDMRRIMGTVDPRGAPPPTAADRDLAGKAIIRSFQALRETFLEELELERPDHPLLVAGGLRLKKSGKSDTARQMQERQQQRLDRHLASIDNGNGDELGRFLAELARREATRA